VSSTILPLAGVVIGACGTLLGRHQALHVDARRESARRALDQRAERKDAIIGFLSATERVEQYRGQLAAEPARDAGDLTELTLCRRSSQPMDVTERVAYSGMCGLPAEYYRLTFRSPQAVRALICSSSDVSKLIR